jgi:3'(2'), 5'-bisphosphate nucleotidase
MTLLRASCTPLFKIAPERRAAALVLRHHPGYWCNMQASPTLPDNVCELLDPLIELASDAGRRILDMYNSPFTVEEKPDHTPVTAADIAAHDAIVAGLDILSPDVPVLSEESEEVSYSVRSQWRTYWLVDPLDGTREFIKGSGEFSVNLALIQDHRPILGVIYVPVADTCYFACMDHGAFKQGSEKVPVPIHTRTLGAQPVIAVSRSRRSKQLEGFLKNLGLHETIAMGSSLKSCLVAEGRADLYPCFGPTSEWDTAAAQCILQEAGGHLTDTNLQPLRYNTKASLLNPHFFAFGANSDDWSKFV